VILPLLLTVDFMNFSYARLPCSANVPPPAIVRKGSYSYFDKKMAVGFDVFVRGVVLGSLRAGTQQAVVTIACDYPVGGTAEAYAYDVHGDTAVLLGSVGSANWGPDWGRGPSSIQVRFANDILYVTDCKDSECTANETKKYALHGDKLVLR
jgi:hypothetical protein